MKQSVRSFARKNVTIVHKQYNWKTIGKKLTDFISGVVYHTSHPSHPLGHEKLHQL